MVKTKLYILLLIAISLVFTGLTGCNKVTRVTLEQVLEKVNAATLEIESFHVTMITTEPGDFISRTEGDFMLPDRMRLVTYQQSVKVGEYRQIGDNVYGWDSETDLWELLAGGTAQGIRMSMQGSSSIINPDGIADALTDLDYIEVLPDEAIDGILCEHYQGSNNDVYNLDYYREQVENETDPEVKEHLENTLANLEQIQEQTEPSALLEVWIGKDDHILRQMRSTMQMTTTDDEDFNGTIVPEGTRITVTAKWTFSNFNEPVEIEEPTLE